MALLVLGALWTGAQWRHEQGLVDGLLELGLARSSLRALKSSPSPQARREFEQRLGSLDQPRVLDSYAEVSALWQQIAGLEEQGLSAERVRQESLAPALEATGVELERAAEGKEHELDRVRARARLASAGLAVVSGLLLVALGFLLRGPTAARGPLGAAPGPLSYTQKILRSISNLLIIISPDSRIQAVNEVALETLGYREEELIGKPLETILAERSDEPPFEASFRNVESAYRTKDGRVIPVLINCSLVSESEGPVQGIVTSAQDISARKLAEAELLEARSHLQQLLDRLVHTQEEERRAVAHDLHDGLLQYIVAAELQLRAGLGEEGAQPDGLLRGMERLRLAVMEGRRLIQNLRPVALEKFGLSEAVRMLVEDLRSGAGWRAAFDSNLGTLELPPALETCAYRIVQEALNNASKHSRTRDVAVALRHSGDEVGILVQDWGTGFDPAIRPAGSVGLDSMRERAELAGGWFRLEAGPGRGTRVEAGLPWRRSDRAASQAQSVVLSRPEPLNRDGSGVPEGSES